jgi:hypothetical protein
MLHCCHLGPYLVQSVHALWELLNYDGCHPETSVAVVTEVKGSASNLMVHSLPVLKVRITPVT